MSSICQEGFEIMKQKRANYVDNKKFYEEILVYKKELSEARSAGLQDPRITNYIGECIFKIANNLSTKPCFMNYSFREEMVSDGIENCILYFKDYDPHIGQNPFAYFTQVIYYAFLRRINKEEKNRYIMCKNFQHTIIHGRNDFGLDNHAGHDTIGRLDSSDDGNVMPVQVYDNINDFMSRFEKKEEVKKLKRKQIKMEKNLQNFYGD